MKLLSVLIPTTHSRQELLYGLLSELHKQADELNIYNSIEIIVELDGGELTVGCKREILLEKAKGKYVVHIDDDDEISADYLKEIVKAIYTNCDVVGFEGYMTTSGSKRENFKISKNLPYMTVQDAYGNNEYLRFNNHLCPIKREIALQIGFKDVRIFEDYDYALRLKQSRLIKTETYIPKSLYHYRYINK